MKQTEEFWRGFRYALAMGRGYIDKTEVHMGSRAHDWMMGAYDGWLDWADKEQYGDDEKGVLKQ